MYTQPAFRVAEMRHQGRPATKQKNRRDLPHESATSLVHFCPSRIRRLSSFYCESRTWEKTLQDFPKGGGNREEK